MGKSGDFLSFLWSRENEYIRKLSKVCHYSIWQENKLKYSQSMALCPCHTCSSSLGESCCNQSLRWRKGYCGKKRRHARILYSCWVWPWSSLVQRDPVENISHLEGQMCTLPCQAHHSFIQQLAIWCLIGAICWDHRDTNQAPSFQPSVNQQGEVLIIICKHSI